MKELSWLPQAPIVLLAGALLIIMFIALRSLLSNRPARAGQLLKSAAAIGLLVILLGPMFADADRASRKPQLVVLVDASGSMALRDADASGSATRLDALRGRWLSVLAREGFTKAMAPTYALISDGYRPAGTVQAIAAGPLGDTTPLADSLRHAVQAAGPDGRVLVLTDGVDTEVDASALQSVAALAAARSVRIDAVIAGGDTPPPDLRLRARADPDVVYQGEASALRVNVVSIGMDGVEADLTVSEGETRSGAVVARRHVQLGIEREFSILVTPHRESDGAGQAYTVTIETTGGANRAIVSRQVFIDVLDAPARVALFDARPHWETTFFAEALRDDPHIELTTVIALAPRRETVRRYSPLHPRRVERLAAVNMDELGRYDVIVLGEGIERWFDADHARALRRFILEDGGALILLRGDPVSTTNEESAELRRVVQSLAPVSFDKVGVPTQPLIVNEKGWRAEMPDVGEVVAIRAALDDVPEIAVTTMKTGKSGWFVWLRDASRGADNTPAIAVGTAGRGRTVESLAHGMWRWAMSPDESTQSRSLYGRLWSNLVRWSALGGEFTPGRALSARFDAGQRRHGEPVEIIVRSRKELSAPGLIATLRDPDGKDHDLALVRPDEIKMKWTASFTPDRQGVYELRASAPDVDQTPVTARLAVYENRRELFDTKPRREQMRRFTQATGGRVWALDGVDQYLQKIQERSESVIATLAYEPAWDEPWVFMLIFGALGGGWLLSHQRDA